MFQVEHQIGLSVVIFRGGVLLVAALTAGMSIFLGWQLFRDAMFSKRATGDLKSKAKQDAIAKETDKAIARAVAEAITGAPVAAKTDDEKAKATETITRAITKATDDARTKAIVDEDTREKEIESKSRPIRIMAGVAGVLFAIYGMMFLVCLAHSQSNITQNLVSGASQAAIPSIDKPKVAP